MTQEHWTEVDRYLAELLTPDDAALRAARHESERAGLPQIAVTASQGALLGLLARAVGAQHILEIGTLGGYSTIHLARALPADGRLVTLENQPAHADVARKNIARAGLLDRVDIRVGPALQTLPLLEKEGQGPFDLVFIDADKNNNPHYLRWSLKLASPGALLIFDNVVRSGDIANPSHTDDRIQGVRKSLEMLAREPRVHVTALQTVGDKGHDGLAIAYVLPDGEHLRTPTPPHRSPERLTR